MNDRLAKRLDAIEARAYPIEPRVVVLEPGDTMPELPERGPVLIITRHGYEVNPVTGVLEKIADET